MDSLITAAARALAAGDALGALKRVALRNDAPALALRGIVMAQLAIWCAPGLSCEVLPAPSARRKSWRARAAPLPRPRSPSSHAILAGPRKRSTRRARPSKRMVTA